MGVLLQILGVVFSIGSLIMGSVSIEERSSPAGAVVLLFIGLAVIGTGRKLTRRASPLPEGGGQSEAALNDGVYRREETEKREDVHIHFMKYDKNYFKAHYGSAYIIAMYVQIGITIICFALLFVLFKGIFFTLAAIVGLVTLILVLPLTFCYYIRFKHQAERQKQWIKDGKLYVIRCFDNGYTAGGFVRHENEILFDGITSVQFTKRYIIIRGDIQIIDKYNGVTREKQVEKYALPRCFTEEERLLRLDMCSCNLKL